MYNRLSIRFRKERRMASVPNRVTWVNHASFIYSAGGTHLLCDPWLSGTAFNNGWRHITDTRFAPEDFARVTHVWISHQHPDHFAPQDLRRVPRADRERVTLLYQPTPDKLVVNWLRSAGYANVVELEFQRWTRISDDLEILCGSLADDSWLAIRGNGKTILNVNDCVLKRRADIEEIRRFAGTVDVLFTQFSYAQWIGNPADTERRRKDAAEKFDRIRLQCEILDPAIVVPFASFVYFSNAENFFMNDSMNRVGDVARFVEGELGRRAIVLYPGETWNVGDVRDWKAAAERYEDDARAKVSAGPVDAPAKVDLDRLLATIGSFLQRVRKKNPLAGMVMRESTSFYVTDHRQAFKLSVKGAERIDATRCEVDVVTSSDNLLYAFRMPWGGNTLHVSGRFESYVPDGHLRFFGVMSKLHYYNKTALNLRWLAGQGARVHRGIARRVSRLAERRATVRT